MSTITSRSRYITYILVIIAVSYPLLFPMGLPIPIDPLTQRSYDIIEALPEGSVILLYGRISGSGWPELGPIAKIMMIQLVRLPVKLVIFGQEAGTSMLWQTEIISKIDMKGKEYGIDYVDVGYIAGDETALAAWASDIHKVSSEDYFRNPIESLSMMENIRTGADFDLVIAFGNPVDFALRQMEAVYGTTIITGAHASSVPHYMPWTESGQISGLIPGLAGAGQYEILVGKPGVGVSSSDAISSTHLLVLALIVAGNYMFFSKRKLSQQSKSVLRKGEEK